MSLYFADFALKLLDYLFSFQWLNFQSVKPARRAKLQLHNLFQSLDGTIVCTLAYRDESFGINDFSRHSFSHPFNAVLVHTRVLICFGDRVHLKGRLFPSAKLQQFSFPLHLTVTLVCEGSRRAFRSVSSLL